MEGHYSTGQSPQRAVAPTEESEEVQVSAQVALKDLLRDED